MSLRILLFTSSKTLHLTHRVFYWRIGPVSWTTQCTNKQILEGSDGFTIEVLSPGKTNKTSDDIVIVDFDLRILTNNSFTYLWS